MTLLKNDADLQKVALRNITISSWPKERLPEGIGLSVKDGWNIGIGFGLAMIIAIPAIVLLLSCIIGIGLSILGSSLGALL